MKSNFHFKSSGELYSKITDGTHDSPKRTLDGKFLITSKHIKGREIDFSSAYLISEEDFKKINERSSVDQWDVIVSMIGEYCGFCYVERNATIDYAVKNVGLIKTGSKLEAEWLYYYLSSEIGKAHILALKSGSSQPYLTLGALRNFPVLVFEDDADKTGLVKVLSDLDSKIEVNNQINQQLETMAKTLYDYWFVQFDFPISTALDTGSNVSSSESRERLASTKVNAGYKSSGGKMVYNEELKREIPDGWIVDKLKDFANTGSGSTPLKSKKEYYENATIPWINSGEVNESFIVTAKKFISEKGLKGSSAKLFPKGTILMAMYGATAGQVSLIDLEACTNQAICAVLPSEECFKYYLKFGLEDLYNYLVNLSSGSARDNLSQDKIRNLYFAIPKQEIIKEFHKTVNPMMEKILINLKENQKLVELRDWLLPMLMNGQVTVGSPDVNRDQVNSNLNSNSNDAGVVDGGLGMVAESGKVYKKGK
jgi:type I restriction enzyme S subunit